MKKTAWVEKTVVVIDIKKTNKQKKMLIIYTITYAKQLIKQKKTAAKIYTIGDKQNKKESERVWRNPLLLQAERDFFFMIFKHFFYT